MNRFNRHDWNKRWKANQKALAKAIKQKRKRSHLRIYARQLETEKVNQLYGSYMGMLSHHVQKRSKQLVNSVTALNPLLERLRLAAKPEPVSGGYIIKGLKYK